MKLKLDENVPLELLDDLREASHDADSVQQEGLAGAPDPLVLDHARGEGRILITLDKGLGNLRDYQPAEFPGIVLLRPPTSGRESTLAFARRHLPDLLTQSLTGRLVVVTERGLRWR